MNSHRFSPSHTMDLASYSERHAGSSASGAPQSKNNLTESDDGPATASNVSSRSNSASNLSLDSFDHADIEIQFFEQGKTLVSEGERNAGLYFVLDGVLEASISTSNVQLFSTNRDGEAFEKSQDAPSNKRQVFFIHPGGLAGYLAALTGHNSFVAIRAKTDVHVGVMSKPILDKYIERYPDVLLCLAKRLVNQLSPLVLHIDVALEWGQLNAGQVLYRQGDPSNSIHIVMTGRLRATLEKMRNGATDLQILGEYGQSESLGELEVLMGEPRTATIHAIRDTEVAIMPKTLFNALSIGHPEITIAISRIIAARSAKSFKSSSDSKIHTFDFAGADSGKNNVNLKTVAVLPVTAIVPISEFADRLCEALKLIGATVALLDSAAVTRKLGKHVFSRLGRLKLLSWLADQEESHRLVLYVADGGINSPWTQRCIRQVLIELQYQIFELEIIDCITCLFGVFEIL